ncbi:hypothetical protein VA7868_01055 [Vibrio aerogenes CECT 7868]|uniref:Immunity protein 53 n=1 Tax=Vibrio aerogenes CECT 7868 TaxID=1216006 RepID=A0A1M5XA30_9VIBR|nr:immunity 53 family protein [Vibrio aerogenes]SHH96626.1 hypothetical protein VA7868_01055 [Vibrio aerogenes CECT 7868]
MSLIKKIQNWYVNQCDGGWEHEFGITIESLDNPGWKVVIPLERTSCEKKEFNIVDIERSENDWIRCEVRDLKFYGYGGSENLEEIMSIFINYAYIE